MRTFWLTYKAKEAGSPKGWPAAEMTKLVEHFRSDPANATQWWRISSHKAARVGDRVLLFKQGSDPRGIFGTGEIIEAPELRADETEPDMVPQHRANVRFDRLIDPRDGFLLELSTIRDVVIDDLVNAFASGNSVPEAVAAELERRLASASLGGEEADDASFDPDTADDLRERTFRAIRMRRGQADFRTALLEAYERRCAVTRCSVVEVLEAAHIMPYLGPHTNHVTNGLLLRADIHTLFDCGLLGIDPVTRTILIADAVRSSAYGTLEGKLVRQPRSAADGPSRRNLEKRHAVFVTQHGLTS